MKKFVLFIVLGFWFANAFSQGYEIKIKINNLSEAQIMLGHHFNDKLYPDDTIKLNKKGEGVFKGKEKLKGGMYFVFLPNKTYFDILVSDNQQFSIENDTTDFLKNMKVKNSQENQAFVEYQKFMLEKQKLGTELNNKKKDLKDEKEKKAINEQLEKIGKEVKDYTDKTIKENQGTFFAKFIKATQEIDVPDFPRDANGKVLDSLFQYKYYKSHFFDNFDIADIKLLQSPIYEEKIKKYLEKVAPQFPDTLCKESDMLLNAAKKDPDVFRYMLITLFNLYASSQIMGFDAIYCHLAENWYIPHATWSDTAFINKTKERVKKIKPLLLGKQAPNIKLVYIPGQHFMDAKSDTAAANNVYAGGFFNLYDIKAKFTVLYFWEADCGHCKKETPLMWESYKNKLKAKGVEFIAVHMLGGREGKVKWCKFVNDHEMYDWINAWNPYEYKYKDLYDIMSTPVVYLLDKDKKIIGKRVGHEQIEEIVDTMLKREEKEKAKQGK